MQSGTLVFCIDDSLQKLNVLLELLFLFSEHLLEALRLCFHSIERQHAAPNVPAFPRSNLACQTSRYICCRWTLALPNAERHPAS
jgi:hypothetical protein